MKKTSFTLLEIILYIGLLSIIILPTSVLFSMVLQSRAESQLNNEIEQQGLQVAQIITQTIRNAKGINSPTIGILSSTLSLSVSDVSKNPTIFELSGNAIKIKEGSGSAVVLTSSAVAPANLIFQNFSRSGTAGIIRVSFSLNSKTFYASASIR